MYSVKNNNRSSLIDGSATVSSSSERYGDFIKSSIPQEYQEYISKMPHPSTLAEYPFKEYKECYDSLHLIAVPVLFGEPTSSILYRCHIPISTVDRDVIAIEDFKESCRRHIAFTICTGSMIAVPYVKLEGTYSKAFKNYALSPPIGSPISSLEEESVVASRILNMEIINMSKAIGFIHKDLVSQVLLAHDYLW